MKQLRIPLLGLLAALVVASPTKASPGSTIDIALDEQDVTILGGRPRRPGFAQGSGISGDFNGDGIDDIVMANPVAEVDGRFEAGEVYVIFGSSALPGTIDIGLGEQDLTILGAETADRLGGSGSEAIAAGDFNGDGIDDLLVGAPFADGPGNTRNLTGEAYVIFGSPTLSGVRDIALEQQDVTVLGADPVDFIGISLGAGDVNGDGIDDMILGASGADGPGNSRFQGSGEIYVILGSGSLSGSKDIRLGEQDLTIFGADPGDALGRRSMSAAGDVNGDGIDDILVGTTAARGPFNARGSIVGEAYVIFGSSTLSGTRDIRLGQQDLIVFGRNEFDALGGSLEIGEFNNDGIGDLLIGASQADGPGNARNRAGEAYVIFGSSGLSGTIDIAAAQQDATIFGAEPLDRLASSVAGGDVNGDGMDDILVGASSADGPGLGTCGGAIGDRCESAGEAYVVFGSPALSGLTDIALEQQDVTIFGRDALDGLGGAVGTGDVNGDGIDDMVVVAGGAGGNGEAYIIFGRSVTSVDLDIKPGGDPNSINSMSQGLIPVAILSTASFDATTVDGTTVQFGPAGASPVHDQTDPAILANHQRDVDGDGLIDYVLHFRMTDTGISEGDTEACVTGQTIGGGAIEGCDSARIVPPWLDSDGDGWGDAVEATLGTDQFAACPADPTHNAWPADLNNDGFSDGTDLVALAGSFGLSVPPAPTRHNVAPDPLDGFVDGTDLTAVANFFGQSCTP